MSNGMIDPAMAETYVDTGPEMVACLEGNSPVQFMAEPDFPDYHPKQAGAASRGGRTLECPVYPYGKLGEWKEKVESSLYYWPHVYFTVGETSLAQAMPDPLDPAEMQRRSPMAAAGARWGREWCSAISPASMPPSATRPPRRSEPAQQLA